MRELVEKRHATGPKAADFHQFAAATRDCLGGIMDRNLVIGSSVKHCVAADLRGLLARTP